MKRAYKMAARFEESLNAKGENCFYIHYTEQGKRKRQRCSVEPCRCSSKGNLYCKHKIEALKEFEVFQAKLSAEKSGEKFNIPIEHLAIEFLDYQLDNKIHTKSTHVLNKTQINMLINFCRINGYVFIHELTHTVLQDYATWLNSQGWKRGKMAEERKYSETYIGMNLRIIRTMLNFGVAKKYITDNPLANTGKLATMKIIKPVVHKPRNILTLEEINTLKDNLSGQWLNMFYVFIFTGMRLSEVTFLTWDRIQEEHINITGNPEIGFAPKWKISRLIRMNKTVKEALNAQREYQKQNKIDTPFVFSTITGNNISNRNCSRFFSKAFETHNIKGEFNNGMSIHCFRHTFITGLINKGFPLPVVQAIAGHQSYETTLKYHKQLQSQQDIIADFDY